MVTPPPVDTRFAPITPGRPAAPGGKRWGLWIALGSGAVGLLLVIVVVIVVAVSVANRNQQRAQALTNLQQEAAQLKANLKPDDDLSKPENAQKVDNAIDRISEAAGAVDTRMKVVVRTVMDEFAAIGRGVAASTNKLMAAGGIDPATMPTLGSVNQRLVLLEEGGNTAKEMLRRLKGIEQLARDTGARNGLSPGEIESFVGGMNKNGKVDRLVRIREIDVELFALFTQLVTLLRDNFDGWEVTDGKLTFGDVPKGTAARYNGFRDKVDTLSQEQNELIKQISGQ